MVRVEKATGFEVASPEEQFINAASLNALLSVLQCSMRGGDAPLKNCLWKNRYQLKVRKPGSRKWTSKRYMFGLCMSESLKRYGVVLLPTNFMLWDTLTIAPNLTYRMAFSQTYGLEDGFKTRRAG